VLIFVFAFSTYRIGFVTQDDILFPQLTVEETLIFSAFLRLPTSMNKQQKYARVETTLKELGLERFFFFPFYFNEIIKHR
jgi:ABC-type multidrug transport system ATPase subunit